MKRLRTWKLFQIFSIEIKKSKTYSGLCPFQGLSNGTTLMQIQSGRMVPLSYSVRQLLTLPWKLFIETFLKLTKIFFRNPVHYFRSAGHHRRNPQPLAAGDKGSTE
jgi:hypothetical protein